MSRQRFWEDGDRYPAQKQPAPEHGIKVKKPGASWWGQRWLDALQAVLGADSGRLARGKTYARAGRTHDLVVKKGKVSARVTGSRAAPYKVEIKLTALSEEAWQRVIAGMAEKAQFTAELLAGQMPHEIEGVFRAVESSLFPRNKADLVTSCTCPDWGDPCKHVAATHYVLGDALDRDPFLLFELRGRTKDRVLEALRVARGAVPSPKPKRGKAAAASRGKGAVKSAPEPTPQTTISADDYDKPRAALPALSFSFDAPAASGALLRQLGAPAQWSDATSAADALAPLVRAAAARAREIALSAVPSGDADAPEKRLPRGRPRQ